jgi:hypothetical protein
MLVARNLQPLSLVEALEIEPVLTVAGRDPVLAQQQDWVRDAWVVAEAKRGMADKTEALTLETGQGQVTPSQPIEGDSRAVVQWLPSRLRMDRKNG